VVVTNFKNVNFNKYGGKKAILGRQLITILGQGKPLYAAIFCFKKSKSIYAAIGRRGNWVTILGRYQLVL
jgi:hypothetical protein